MYILIRMCTYQDCAVETAVTDAVMADVILRMYELDEVMPHVKTWKEAIRGCGGQKNLS